MNLQVQEQVRRVATFRWYWFFFTTDRSWHPGPSVFLVCLKPKIYPHCRFHTPRFRNQAIAIASSTIASTTFAPQCVGWSPPSHHRIHVEWISTHAHYELCDLGRACCIPVHRYSVGIATGYTDLSQIPQITKNTGISPNITSWEVIFQCFQLMDLFWDHKLAPEWELNVVQLNNFHTNWNRGNPTLLVSHVLDMV